MLIDTYKNEPGQHCGSTAMRNLLRHYCGLELSEAVVFGLGAGIDAIFIDTPQTSPSPLLFGRGLSLEVDLCRALGIDYREQPEFDDQRAWDVVKKEVDAGRPTMLSGDVYYLDYRDFKVHFPAHRFVLLGYDDECAWVADRIDAEPQSCSFEALRQSRNPPAAISTYNLWGKFHDTEVTNSMEEAVAWSLRTTRRRMSGEDATQATLIAMASQGAQVETHTGLAGIRAFGASVLGWGNRDDAEQLARYNSACIERYGTGGGNFRLLYAGFLDFARQLSPELVGAEKPSLARESAAMWTALSVQLLAGDWSAAAETTTQLERVETALCLAD